MAEIKLQTGTRVFEVLAYLCHGPLEALKQFVENGADAIEQSGRSDGRIRIRLDQETNGDNFPSTLSISIEDNGIGMDVDKMNRVVQRIGDSEKLHDVLRGEKGVGILAFALLANEIHLSSVTQGSTPACLVLKKEWLKEGRAESVPQCLQHRLNRPGTRAYLIGILPEIAPQLTKARIKQYLSREFAHDLRRNLFTIQVGDTHGYDIVEPRLFSGAPTLLNSVALQGGARCSIHLYTLPYQSEGATVDLHGRGGIRLCSLTDLDEFKKEPWLGQRLEGSVRCDQLRGTADKAAAVQDGIYREMAELLHSQELYISGKIVEVTQEYRDSRLNEIMNRVDRFIAHFLRYRETGDIHLVTAAKPKGTDRSMDRMSLPGSPLIKTSSGTAAHSALAFLHVDFSLPPENQPQVRAWFDDRGSVKINMFHTDFLSSERDDKRCAWYLFTVWAKQFLLTEYGRDAETMADEMVGLFSRAAPLFNQFSVRPQRVPVSTGKEIRVR